MIEVEAPDGTVVEFPAGTAAETIRRVMQARFPPRAAAAQPATQPAAAVSADRLARQAEIDARAAQEAGISFFDSPREAQAAGFQPSRFQAAVAGAAHGGTLGAADEIIGGVSHLLGRGYEAGRDRTRAFMDASRRDFPGTTLAGEVAGAVALPGAARTWKMGLGLGAGFGGTYGALATDGGAAERGPAAVLGAAVGGAVGAAAVPIAQAVTWAGRNFGQGVANVFRSNRLFRNGQLTQEGEEAVRRLGYAPEEISDEFSRHFERAARESVQPQDAAVVANMREFGIPAYRHNVTGLAGDFATFERARRGAVGNRAEMIVRNAADTQFQAAKDAGERIAMGMGGEAVDQSGAAVLAQQGVRRARDAARQTAGEAYDALEAAGGGVRGPAVAGIGSRVRNNLRVAGVQIDPRLTPNAASAIADLDSVFKASRKGAVPFMDLERARQNLVRLRKAASRGSLGADQRAMGEVVQAFDDQVDRLMTTAMVEGNDEVLAVAQKARGLWAHYRQTFAGDGAASRFIQKMADEDASPDDVAKWLFSAGKLGSGQFNSTMAKGLRDVLGETSEEWNAIRQAAFRQMTQRPEGIDEWGPAALSTRLNEFIGGHTTRDLSRTLFTVQEIATIKRFAGALSRMKPPTGAINNSGTAYELSRVQNARRAQQAFTAISSMIGAGGMAGMGSVTAAMGAGAGFLTAAAIGAARSAVAVRGMLSSRAPGAAANVGRAAIGAGVGASAVTNPLVQDLLR